MGFFMTGRPSKYKPEYDEQAAKLSRLGATLPEVADFFDVAPSTVSLWMLQHESFSEAIKNNRAFSDENVEASLYHRALGYSHEHEDIKVVEGEIVVTKTTKHYPPDPTAMIFWLKNRKPKQWRDKQEVESTTNVTHNIMTVPSAASVEEWEQSSEAVHDKNFGDND